MKRTFAALVALASVGGALALPGPAAASDPCGPLTKPRLSISFTNTGPIDPREIYITVTGNGTGNGVHPCTAVNHGVRLSDLPRFKKGPHWYHLELGSGISSGEIWISYKHRLKGLPTIQPSFDTSMTRFANVEFTFPGSADMTNVDQFSFPVDLTTFRTRHGREHLEKMQTRRYTGTTCDIVSAMHSAVDTYSSTYTSGPAAAWSQIAVEDTAGDLVRVVAPKQRTHQPATTGGDPNPFAQGWPSMVPYVESMANQPITIEGLFSPGSGSAYTSQAGWYRYTGTFAADGSIKLTGTYGASTMPGGTGAVPGRHVKVTGSFTDALGNPNGLATGIYDQASQYTVGTTDRNTPDGAHDAPDDVYNSIYRDLTTAFTYGYPGGTYGTANSGWWNTWNPPTAPSGGQPAFAAARVQPDPTQPGGDQFFAGNLWAQALFGVSTNYAIPYGEDYGSGAPSRPSPLVDITKGTELHLTIGKDGPAGCLANL